MSCAVPRHRTPAGLILPSNCRSSRYVELHITAGSLGGVVGLGSRDRNRTSRCGTWCGSLLSGANPRASSLTSLTGVRRTGRSDATARLGPGSRAGNISAQSPRAWRNSRDAAARVPAAPRESAAAAVLARAKLTEREQASRPRNRFRPSTLKHKI